MAERATCQVWRPNLRRICGRPAVWACTGVPGFWYLERSGALDRRLIDDGVFNVPKPKRRTYFVCSTCTRGTMAGMHLRWGENFRVERLMSPPPKAVVA